MEMNSMRMPHFVLWLLLASFTVAPEAFAFYNPTAGRWLNRDPLHEAGGATLYAFANNAPLSSVDVDGRIPLDTLLDLGFLAYDLATGSGAATIATDIAALVIPYVPNPAIAQPIIKPVTRWIEGQLREVQIVERAGLRETLKMERNPFGRNPKLTVRFEYVGLNTHPQGQNWPKHFKFINGKASDALAWTATHPDSSQWRVGLGDGEVRRLIDEALAAYVARNPQPHYSTLNKYVHDFALPHPGDTFGNALADNLSIVGYSNGKCTTRIRLDVGTGGEIHAYPVP